MLKFEMKNKECEWEKREGFLNVVKDGQRWCAPDIYIYIYNIFLGCEASLEKGLEFV